MNRATLKLRKFAERIIAVAAIDNKSSVSKPPSYFTALEKLRPCLAQIVGNGGFNALLSRALTIGKEDIQWLDTVHVTSDGSLAGLDDLDGKVPIDDIVLGKVVLLAEFLNLLVEIIGERLMLEFMNQAFPNASTETLYFSQGE